MYVVLGHRREGIAADLPNAALEYARELPGEISDAGFGLITHFRMPGGVVAVSYEPRYKVDYR